VTLCGSAFNRFDSVSVKTSVGDRIRDFLFAKVSNSWKPDSQSVLSAVDEEISIRVAH
jgi:hypothetical protein